MYTLGKGLHPIWEQLNRPSSDIFRHNDLKFTPNVWDTRPLEMLYKKLKKHKKIYSGQVPISVTIIPSECKLFEQFLLLWFKFSQCRLMLGPTISNSDQPIATCFAHDTRDICCQGTHTYSGKAECKSSDKYQFFNKGYPWINYWYHGYPEF